MSIQSKFIQKAQNHEPFAELSVKIKEMVRDTNALLQKADSEIRFKFESDESHIAITNNTLHTYRLKGQKTCSENPKEAIFEPWQRGGTYFSVESFLEKAEDYIVKHIPADIVQRMTVAREDTGFAREGREEQIAIAGAQLAISEPL